MQTEARLTEYRTVYQVSEARHEVSRSRFIGRCFPVETEAQALSVLERVRKDDWDARHNCFAYRIGAAAACARYSDDGEPAGTAGQPIMRVLQQQSLTDVLCVVTRYFGGILLGTGGLVRAYTKACQDAVSAAGISLVTPCSWYVLTVAYPLWNAVKSFLEERVMVDSVVYTDTVCCTLHIRRCDAAAFLTEWQQKTDARAVPLWQRDGYAVFRCTEGEDG